MMRTILTYPDPVLSQKARPIEDIDDDIRRLAEDMAETMYAKDGIGLAAPQVGESCRLIVIDVTGPSNREDLRVIVNPVIESAEGEVESEEGCLSVSNYRCNVRRAERVRVTGLDLDGNPVDIEADDILAICIQHEIDHLDGTLFIDRISRLKRVLYDKKVKKWLKRQENDSE